MKGGFSRPVSFYYICFPMKKSTSELIMQRLKRGKIYFLQDFMTAGNYDSVKTELSRLTKAGVLKRLGVGIYLYPKIDPELGEMYPSLDEIAYAIAERDHVRITPTAEHAMHRLGLSEQVPLNPVYLTEGRSKEVKIGKHTITFKQSTPKKVAARGKISSPLILALSALGKDGITEQVMEMAKALLSKENPTTLQKDLKSAPTWLADILLNIVKDLPSK